MDRQKPVSVVFSLLSSSNEKSCLCAMEEARIGSSGKSRRIPVGLGDLFHRCADEIRQRTFFEAIRMGFALLADFLSGCFLLQRNLVQQTLEEFISGIAATAIKWTVIMAMVSSPSLPIPILLHLELFFGAIIFSRKKIPSMI
jgi:hypothetical protein